MKAALDNTTLIQKFLKGEDSLLANRELRIEKAREETQLLTNQGILLAKRRFNTSLPNVMVRLKSDHWQLLHQLTLEANFIPFQLDQVRYAGETFAQYDYHSVPAGYQIHCQEASAFWKTWWVNHRKLELMDLLLLCEKRWYPVNKMLCETGTIYVRTWQGEKTLAVSDTVVWLDRNTQTRRKRIQVRKHHAPGKQIVDSPYPYHNEETSSPRKTSGNNLDKPIVPGSLQKVVRAGRNKLIIQTALGPILIEGKELTCRLGQTVTKVS
ncbi:MAG: hypothetical protein AAF959_29865 [Cyanobacteria bacterium P01_D01_bin.56]